MLTQNVRQRVKDNCLSGRLSPSSETADTVQREDSFMSLFKVKDKIFNQVIFMFMATFRVKSWINKRTRSMALHYLLNLHWNVPFCQNNKQNGKGDTIVTHTPILPVRMDWSTRRVVDFMDVILISAGTLSPTI